MKMGRDQDITFRPEVDVETTNWNAVKLLATRYGVELKSPEEMRDSYRKLHENSDVEGCSEFLEEDLGIGTPFQITAVPVNGNRTVYRFKSRDTPADRSQTPKAFHKTLAEDDDFNDTGYHADPDSPKSSLRKDKKKQSSRTLRVARSIPAFRALQSNQGTSKSTNSSRHSKDDLEFKQSSHMIDDDRKQKKKLHRLIVPPPERLQRGDVMGAILGLRQEIHASDYEFSSSNLTQNVKGKTRERTTSDLGSRKESSKNLSHVQTSVGPWRSISPFGATVMQRDQTIRPDKSIQGIQTSSSSDTAFLMPREKAHQNERHDLNQQQNADALDAALEFGANDFALFDAIQQYRMNRKKAHSLHSLASSPTTKSFDLPENQQTDSALPGDDPRFAFWAVRSSTDENTLLLSSRDGEVEGDDPSQGRQPQSPQSVGRGRKRSSARSSVTSSHSGSSPAVQSKSSSQTSAMFPSHGAFLLAAAAPYLVAELTSHIDNRFMTDFFYTFRGYMAPCDLLQLLKKRFIWSLKDVVSYGDETRRKIIRVRTYVVLKYWLANFFTLDFVPSQRLRHDMATWLNESFADQRLRERSADLSIIKSLARLVKSLKVKYEEEFGAVDEGIARGPEANHSPEVSEMETQIESVDLSLAGDEQADDIHPADDTIGSPRIERRKRGVGKSSISTSDLKRSAQATNPPTANVSFHAPPPLPSSQSALSRAFVTTFSRISRFKRHLNARNTHNPFVSDTVEGTDSDHQECHDLLYLRGGLESFLDFFAMRHHSQGLSAGGQSQSSGEESQDPVSDSTLQDKTPSLISNHTHSTPASSFDLGAGSPTHPATKDILGLGITSNEVSGTNQMDSHRRTENQTSDLLHHFQSDQTLRSASVTKQATSLRLSASPSEVAQQKVSTTPLQANNVVQIDDIDFSSDEEDGMVQKALRRLPGARDLRMANHVHDLETAARQSFDSISSLGRVYAEPRRSLASYYEDIKDEEGSISVVAAIPQSARPITTVTSEMLDPDEALRGFELVKGFRVDQLEDSDDEESGDVEAALRRLEGVIDQDKQRERQRKVEAMWLRSQERQREEQEAAQGRASTATSLPSQPEEPQTSEQGPDPDMTVSLPTSDTVKQIAPAKTTATMDGGAESHVARGHNASLPIPRTMSSAPPLHRSFLLDYRSDVIAKQFSLIEAELFRAVTWQELVSGQWKVKYHPGQVLDWQSFYQNRARNRVEAQGKGMEEPPESNVEAITARFNLVCNWVASEIVLTSTIQLRAAVVRKMIRIAWKCYQHSNFSTLSQIILGLQSPWVERLTKTWAHVGIMEMRMLRDLKAFINPARNFKHLRNAMRNMIVQGQMEDLITSTGPPQPSDSFKSHIHLNDGCIPFFGLYLSDLAVHDALPTFIDASCPDAAPSIDPRTGRLKYFADPAALQHLPLLPKGVDLYPLVNLYKFRILAMTVKSVLALQERLTAFSFPVERAVYVKALKLRCLEAEHLTTISYIAEP